jgi:hypothetical protein
MQIKSSLDWSDVHTQLRNRLSNVPYNPDLVKILRNIGETVSQLSRLEVDARRTQKYSYLEKQVDMINKSIDHLEKLLLIAELMK